MSAGDLPAAATGKPPQKKQAILSVVLEFVGICGS